MNGYGDAKFRLMILAKNALVESHNVASVNPHSK